MSRANVISEMEQGIDRLEGLSAAAAKAGATPSPLTVPWLAVLREVLALLKPPTTGEIEAAREFADANREEIWGFDEERRTINRALDALAREPCLEARLEQLRDAGSRFSRAVREKAGSMEARAESMTSYGPYVLMSGDMYDFESACDEFDALSEDRPEGEHDHE